MNPELLSKITNLLIYILIGLLSYILLSKVLKKFVKENNKKTKTIVNLIKNILKYILAIIVIVLMLEEFNIDTRSIVASLGIAGLIIGLAIQDLIKDFIAGIFIMFDDLYNVGDVVTINDFKGEIISFGLKTTKVKSFKGDMFAIANGKITYIINHSNFDSLAIVDIPVPYEIEVDKIIKILNDHKKELEDKIVSKTGDLNILGVQELADSSVVIRLTINTKAEEQYGTERILKQEIKALLASKKINIPYKQMVIHNDK